MKNLLYISILFLTVSCSILKKSSSVNSSFSPAMQELINDGTDEQIMRVFKITDEQDSILLRMQCTDIAKEDLALARKLSSRMLATVQDSLSAGVGIAAPQVGILKNMVIVQRFDKEAFPFETYVNPKIVSYSEEKQPCPEGCLSIPEKQAITQNRAKSIDIEYMTLEGEMISETVSAFTAVVFQHEIDHLNGILFIDHLEEELKE